MKTTPLLDQAWHLKAHLDNLTTRCRNILAEISSLNGQSPAEKSRRMMESQALEVYFEFTKQLLGLAELVYSEHEHPALPMLHEAIKETFLKITKLEASNYAESVDLHPRPWTECQLARVRNSNSCVWHDGTGNRQGTASGSSSEPCRGPLRTDQERALGLCGSCLNKFGPGLGIDGNTPAEWVPQEWKQ